MKNIILFILIIFFHFTNAQTKLGVTIGATSFDVNSAFYEYSSSIGTEFGSHVRFIIDDSSELLIEATVNLSKGKVVGTEYINDMISETMDYKFNYSSMNIGVYYNYSIIPKRISLFAGPTLSYSLSRKFKENIDGKDIRFGDSSINAEAIETIDPFLYLSAGFTVGVENLKLRLKYSYGLGNSYKEESFLNQNTYEQLSLDAKTSLISLSIMYSIDFY